MIIFLYGPDEYRRAARRAFLELEFEKKYGVRPETLDLEAADGIENLQRAAGETSLFSAKKLLILKNPYALEPKILKPLLAPFMESKDLYALIVADKKPVKALEVLLSAAVKAEEFPYLTDAAWSRFVKSEAGKTGADISPEALQLLSEAYAGDTWSFVTEMQKLAYAPNKIGTQELFEMGLDVGADSFPLIQGLKSRLPAPRLRSLALLLGMREPAAKIFNILAALWPQNIGAFAKYDKNIKFGRMDYEEALTDLVMPG